MSQNSVYSHHSVCTLCPHVLPSAGWRKGQCSQVVTLGQSLRNVIPEKYWVLTLRGRKQGATGRTERRRKTGTEAQGQAQRQGRGKLDRDSLKSQGTADGTPRGDPLGARTPLPVRFVFCVSSFGLSEHQLPWSFAGPAVTKGHRLDGLNDNLIVSQCGGQMS